MKFFLKKYNLFFKYCLIPILIFSLFKKGIDKLIEVLFVKPIFSYCYPADYIYDIAIIVIFLILLGPIIKIKNGAKIPNKWNYIFITYITIYLAYRIPNVTFVFTTFGFSSKIKLLDFISLAPFIVLIYNFKIKRKDNNLSSQNSSGFTVDEAIQIDEQDDLFKRSKFINEVANKIKNTSSKNASFPIGIIASWGSGKTTFLNTLVGAFDENYIVIEFNVWKCKTTNQIIESFFKLLIEKLRVVSFDIEHKIKDYAEDLIKDSQSKNIVNSVFNILFPNQSLEKEYDTINEELKKIDKKIIVFIDDIDRLDKIEIYEVIRLIRNTANFSNTFFIVAYDRNYILNAIEEINPYQSHYFLEKIFQVEFTLPPIDFDVLKKEIIRRLNIFLTDESKLHLEKMFEATSGFMSPLHLLTNKFILNMRDVIRFVNSFKLSYVFINDEIFFPDFFNLELIKYKHPELFNEFYRNRNKFLSNNHHTFASSKDLFYSLKKISGSDDKEDNTELEKFLNNSKSIYKLNNNDIEILNNGFSEIFSQENKLTKISSLNNSNLSVIYPSMFDRYFILGIEGMLSQIEFSKARNSTIEQFNTQITKWCQNPLIISEVADRLSLLNTYNNQDDFEKVISAIFHFATQKINNGFIGYNSQDLYYKLEDYEDKITKLYYNGNEPKYKEFLLGLFANANRPFLFEADFIRYINSQSQIYLPISKDELTNITTEYLKKYLDSVHNTDNTMWRLFYACEQTTNGKIKECDDARNMMKEFMIEKDFNGFLINSINLYPHDYSKFSIAGTVLMLFNNWEEFKEILKQQNSDKWTYLEEFKLFFEKCQEKNFSVYINFDFKVIPIEERVKLYKPNS